MITQWLADALDLEVPQITLALALFTVFPLALIHRQINDVTTKHIYSLLCGLSLAFYTFGNDIVHLLVTPVVCYAILIFLPRKISPFVITTLLMIYMSYGYVSHFVNLLFDYYFCVEF